MDSSNSTNVSVTIYRGLSCAQHEHQLCKSAAVTVTKTIVKRRSHLQKLYSNGDEWNECVQNCGMVFTALSPST